MNSRRTERPQPALDLPAVFTIAILSYVLVVLAGNFTILLRILQDFRFIHSPARPEDPSKDSCCCTNRPVNFKKSEPELKLDFFILKGSDCGMRMYWFQVRWIDCQSWELGLLFFSKSRSIWAHIAARHQERRVWRAIPR